MRLQILLWQGTSVLLPFCQTLGSLWCASGAGMIAVGRLGPRFPESDKQGIKCAGGPGVAYPGNLNGGPVVELGGNPAQNYTGPGTYVVRSGTFGSANLGGLLVRAHMSAGLLCVCHMLL